MSPNQRFYHDLPVYVRRRTAQLQSCHILVEQKIENDKIAYLDRHRENRAFPLGKALHHLDVDLGNTLRCTLLIGVCSVLEESVKAIGKQQVSDDKVRTTTMSETGQKGKNWLQRHIHLLSTHAGFDPNGRFSADADQFSDLIVLRNCVAHSWGDVANDSHPESVRAAVKRIEAVAAPMNCRIAAISGDRILLHRDMVPHGLFLTENIIDGLCCAMADKLKSPMKTT
jgi:hypothetical protein